MSKLLSLASGEFFLKDRANGGAVIFLRSVWVTVILFLTSIGLREFIDPARSWVLDVQRMRELAATHFTWLGPIFAATYAAFYARFSSQWTYLQNVYNAFMSAATRIHKDDPVAQECLCYWEAGFIEDADTLHLATKPIFAKLIQTLIDDEVGVREAFIDATPGGEKRLERIKRQVDRVVSQEEAHYSFSP